jgi:hypothetical protein
MNIKKITYTDPASAARIMDAKGDGFGIQNLEQGLFLNGKTYPKGTVFEVRDGMVEPAGSPVFGIVDFLLAAGFERVGERRFRRGDTDIRLPGDRSAYVSIYGKHNGTVLLLTADTVALDSAIAPSF